jgi:hypothetical protein
MTLGVPFGCGLEHHDSEKRVSGNIFGRATGWLLFNDYFGPDARQCRIRA